MFGEPWMGPHPLCEAETTRACQRFDEAVTCGESQKVKVKRVKDESTDQMEASIEQERAERP